MSRIETKWHPNSQIDNKWILTHQEQIKKHPAWQGNIDKDTSEALLKGALPFTFVLLDGGQEHLYFISFVRKDLSIKHQSFTLELDKKGWYYKNGYTDGLAELVKT